MIGQLIAAAGRGQTASPEARQRIYATVRARWKEQTIGQHSTESLDESDRRRTAHNVAVLRPRSGHPQPHALLNRWSASAIGLAATVAAVALTLGLLRDDVPDVGLVDAQFAQIARISGNAELIRDGESRGLDFAAIAKSIEPGDTLRTDADARVALRTDDGLLLRVSVSTELQFVDLTNVELVAGTIYIDAGDGISSPELEVGTPLGGVQHLGTQYEVGYDDSRLRVRVREGRVAFRGNAQETIGVAGQQFEIDTAGMESRSTIEPDDPSWDWAISMATLPPADTYSLDEVLNWIARERGLTLSFVNASTRQRVNDQSVVGLDGLNPLETLEVIQRTSGLRAEIRESRLVITN